MLSSLCIHQLFEKQAASTPNAIALLSGEETITYRELNERANQLARFLKRTELGPETPIGICIDRSPEMATGLLAALKVGGCYVPLDPSYPPERLLAMAQGARLRIVLTSRKLATSQPDVARAVQAAHTICLDEVLPDLDRELGHDLDLDVRPEHLLYVLFTSGSTGAPKGVAMPHRALSNLLRWQQEQTQVALGQRTLQFTPLSFDVATQEIFATWCFGGTLVLASDAERRNPQALLRLLETKQVERLFLPFVALQHLAETAQGRRPSALREVITAGEQLQITPAITAFFSAPGCRLHNQYGPTESHVATAYTLSDDVRSWPALPPIGRPIDNVRIHLLDEERREVPPGETGELHIGGVCLARGYYFRPELTEERFVVNPADGERIYKTGDLARSLPDGNIEFLGRSDHQVKIRGFRVELGEIEVVLGQHPHVKAAVAMARTDAPGMTRLAAYVVPGAAPLDGDSVTALETELRSYLQARLPEYMVPAAFVVLPALPLTPSGKVDRRALPAPQLRRPQLKTPFILPQDEIQASIAAVWQEALQIDVLGIDDHFFELGGNSLLLIQVHARLSTRFSGLELTAVLQHPTIRSLSESIRRTAAGEAFPERAPSRRLAQQDAAATQRQRRRAHRNPGI